MPDLLLLDRRSKVRKLGIVISSALACLLWALPTEAQNLALSTTSKTCSEGLLSGEQLKFVPIQIGALDDETAVAVSVRELKQRIPGKARKAVRKALEAWRHSRAEEAERHLAEALKIEPDYFQAAMGLAAMFFDSKRYTAARLYAERAHAANPEYAPPLEILGALDVLEGQAAKAIAEFTNAERYSPLQWAAHYYLGVAFLHIGQCENASEHLEAAAELRDKPRGQQWHHLPPIETLQPSVWRWRWEHAPSSGTPH